MKKLGLILCGIVSLTMLTTMAFAASVGDIIEPIGHLKVAVSAEADYILDKDLDGTIENDATAGAFSSAEIDSASKIYGKVVLGVTDYLNIYAKLGAAGLDMKLKEADGTACDIETEYGTLWGGGISGAKEIHDGWNLGADIQALFYKTDVDEVTYAGAATSNIQGELDNYEFQAALFVNKKFEVDLFDTGEETILTPYLGVKYLLFSSESDGNITFTATAPAGNIIYGTDLEGDNEVGVFGGVNVDLTESVVGNVEVRLVDETAISGSLAYKF